MKVLNKILNYTKIFIITIFNLIKILLLLTVCFIRIITDLILNKYVRVNIETHKSYCCYTFKKK